MELKNETKVGFTAEVSIIPVWAWILAVIGFAAMQVVARVVRQPDAPTHIVRALMGLLAGAVVACYLLLIGYITPDARRRGMSPVLWTFVAILVPNTLFCGSRSAAPAHNAGASSRVASTSARTAAIS